MTDDNDVKELAKLIYANITAVTFSQNMDKLRARVLAASSFEAAKVFYEYANDRKNPK